MDGQHSTDFAGKAPGISEISGSPETPDLSEAPDLNAEEWRRSLEISVPLDMPAPERQAIFSGSDPGETAISPIETTNAPVNPVESSLETPKTPAETPKAPGATLEPPKFPELSSNSPELGQITPINAPGVSDAPGTPGILNAPGAPSYNPASIKTTGDKLEKSSIAEVDNAISELSQTGNLSNFYDEIRNMTESNLDNSYGRKLGEQGGIR